MLYTFPQVVANPGDSSAEMQSAIKGRGFHCDKHGNPMIGPDAIELLKSGQSRPAIEFATKIGSPVEGAFARCLYLELSANRYGALYAADIYRKCGYVPFCGYPLKKL